MRLRLALAAVLALFARTALATPAIDGIAAFNACGSGNPLVITTTLTTISTQDAIIVMVTMGNTPVWVNTITDTAGLTYTRRMKQSASSPTTDRWEEWYAPAASTLTGDIITVTATSAGGSNCIKVMAIGISGAQWPVPFDPLYNWPYTLSAGTNPQFTTQGTDDLLLAHYGITACTPTAGLGWTLLYSINGSDLLEYQTTGSPQTNYQAAQGAGCGGGNVQTVWSDAFVSAAGLGVLEQSSKVNTYAILQTGMGTSKQNMYVIAEPGIGTSKLNSYVILNGQTNVINPNSGLTLFHAFPP